MLLVLIAGQLVIVGQLGGEIHLWRIRLFLEVGDNVLEEDDLIDKAIRDVFALFWEAAVLKTKNILSCFQK